MSENKWRDRAEKRITSFTTSTPITFANPDKPYQSFKDWSDLLLLRLQQFDIPYVLSPIKEAIEYLTEQACIEEKDSKRTKAEVQSTFQFADVSTRIFILQSLPPLFRINHGSFTNIIDERSKLHGQAYSLYNAIKDLLSIPYETDHQELMFNLCRTKFQNESMSTYLGVKNNSRQVLRDKYQEPIVDTMFKSIVMAGIKLEKDYDKLYQQFLTNRPQPSLPELVSTLNIAALEIEAKPKPISSTPNEQQIALAARKFYNKPRSPCFHFAKNGQCRQGDQCSFLHVPSYKCKTMPCPNKIQCERIMMGKCPFLHNGEKQQEEETANFISSTSQPSVFGNSHDLINSQENGMSMMQSMNEPTINENLALSAYNCNTNCFPYSFEQNKVNSVPVSFNASAVNAAPANSVAVNSRHMSRKQRKANKARDDNKEDVNSAVWNNANDYPRNEFDANAYYEDD